MNLLGVYGLSKRFTIHSLKHKEILAFENVSFEVKQGEGFVLTGPSGVGKSSVLKCIYRTYLSSSGRIRYESGQFRALDLTSASEHTIVKLRHCEIGYVSQFLKVLPRLPAVDVVAEPLRNGTMPYDAAKAKARELLGRLNIDQELFDAYPATFSGGEQQRVNIARALIRRPRLLLLDEPTAALDAMSIQRVVKLLNELREKGTTIIMILHDPHGMQALADTVYEMRVSRHQKTVSKLPALNMEKPDFIIENGRIVTPGGILDGATLTIKEGRIQSIGAFHRTAGVKCIDASGFFIMPGFIDLHSDAIEKEIQPRPGGKLPIDIAIVELDKKLASCGVTTMCHCLCFEEVQGNELRRATVARQIALRIHRLNESLSVRNRIHARFEILDLACVELLEDLIRENVIQLFSLMDHTPGQGQFASLEHFETYYGKAEHLCESEVRELAERRMRVRRDFEDTHVRRLMRLCKEHHIPVASHDDDTAQKVFWARDLGAKISEFPVTLEAAKAARRLGMHVLMGAPNILRGSSLTDNLSGREAIQKGYCDLIGSDYSPTSILHAVFELHRLGMGELHELVKMVTFNAAHALGMENQIGSIVEGLLGDLVMVDASGDVPRIMRSFVNGKQVFSAC